MRDVAIVGAGCTRFGEMWERSFRDLFVEAGVKALEDAGVHGDEIDAMYVGNMSAGRFVLQEHVGALIADYSGLGGSTHIPSTRVESACSSGGLALREGVLAVASGYHDVVVVGAVEKMTDVQTGTTVDTLSAAADREWESAQGATFPGLNAMMARLHMHRYGTTREQMAQVSVKNHANGVHNPRAQFQFKVSIEDVINSTMVADPLRLLDCPPITDGAAALVLVPAEDARKYSDAPVYVQAATQASDTISLHDRRDPATMDATVHAGKWAYQAADVTPRDIDVVEIHDGFTITELIAFEDLGFVPKGESGPATMDGVTAIDGDIPVNPSGGIKACGHPVGATGVRQAVDVVEQLRGECGKRQVEGAEVGMTHNVGGTGSTVVVHILSR